MKCCIKKCKKKGKCYGSFSSGVAYFELCYCRTHAKKVICELARFYQTKPISTDKRNIMKEIHRMVECECNKEDIV